MSFLGPEKLDRLWNPNPFGGAPLNNFIKPMQLKILLSLGSLVFLFTAAEVAVRVMGEWDVSGNFYFKNRIIRPHRLPLEMARSGSVPWTNPKIPS